MGAFLAAATVAVPTAVTCFCCSRLNIKMKQFIPFLLLPMLALSVAAAGTSGGERQIRLEDIERDTLAAARQRQAAKQSKQVPQGSQAQQLKGASISEAEHPQLYSPQYGQRTQLVHPQLIQQQLAQQHLTPQQLSQQQLAHPQLSQYQLGQQQLVQQHYPASIAQQPEQQVVHLRPEQLSAYLQRQHSQQAALLQQLYQPQHPALAAYSQPQQTLSAYSQPQKATPSAGHAQSQQQAALAAYAQQQALTAHAQPQQALTGHAQPQQALVAYAQQQALNAHAQPQQALTANGHQQALAGHGQSTRPQQLQQQPVYYYQPSSSAKPTAAYSAAAGGHSAAPAYYFPQGSFAGASSGIPNSALSSYVDPQQQQYLQLQLQQYLQQQYPGHLYRYQVAAPAAGLGTSGAAAPGSTLQYSSAQRQALANHGSPATATAPQQAVQYVYQLPSGASAAHAAAPSHSPAQAQYLQHSGEPKAVYSSGVKSTPAPTPAKASQQQSAHAQSDARESPLTVAASNGFVPSTRATAASLRHHPHQGVSYSTYRRGRGGF